MDGLRLERRDATGLADVRHELLDVYAEIYADRLGEEFHSIERFDERLGWNTEVPGFAAVVGYLDDTPIGYAYGCTLPADTRWWNGLLTPVPDGAIVETGARTFALSELMVVEKFRGTGVAHQIHHELLRGRPEERVTLLVERDHPKVLPEDLTDRVTWGRRSALPEERGFTAGLAAEDVTAAPTAEVR